MKSNSLRSTVAAAVLLATAAAAQVTPPDPGAVPGSTPAAGPTPDTAPGPSPSPAATVSGPGMSAGHVDPVHTAQAAPSSSTTTTTTSSSNDYNRNDGYSLLPFTRRGYASISVNRADFKTGCGNGAYGCGNPDVGMSIATGGLFNPWVGLELGYMNTGKAPRLGGETRAQGLSVSLVARAPMGPFNVFAKGGTVYGQTDVSTGPSSDLVGGRRRGWGGLYGVGLGFDFTPTSGVVLEWTRHEFNFPNTSGRDNVDLTSLGYVMRF